MSYLSLNVNEAVHSFRAHRLTTALSFPPFLPPALPPSFPPFLPPALPPQVFFRYYPERVQTLEYFGWKWWWPSLEEGEEAEAPQPYNRYNNFEGMDLVLKLNVSIPPSLPPSLPTPWVTVSIVSRSNIHKCTHSNPTSLPPSLPPSLGTVCRPAALGRHAGA